MAETWPNQTVFLPLDDPLFVDRQVAYNSEDLIYATPLREQYDALILRTRPPQVDGQVGSSADQPRRVSELGDHGDRFNDRRRPQVTFDAGTDQGGVHVTHSTRRAPGNHGREAQVE